MLLERARKKRGRLANTPCLFKARHQDHGDLDITVGEEAEEYFTPTTAGECVQFWPWVNKVNSPVSLILLVVLIMSVDTYDSVSRTAFRDCNADFQTTWVSFPNPFQSAPRLTLFMSGLE